MPEAKIARHAELVSAMLALQPTNVNHKKCTPRTLTLSRDGQYVFAEWFEGIEDAKRDASDDIYIAQLSKIAELPGRIAIVLHELETVDVPDACWTKDLVSAEAMARALAISEWLRHEQQRNNYLAKMDHELEQLRSLDQ